MEILYGLFSDEPKAALARHTAKLVVVEGKSGPNEVEIRMARLAVIEAGRELSEAGVLPLPELRRVRRLAMELLERADVLERVP